MSRVITGVDAVVAAWILHNAEAPTEALTKVERFFKNRRGKLGYLAQGEGVKAALGVAKIDGIENIRVTDHGTLTGTVIDEDCSPNLHWCDGTLSLWRRQVQLPQTLMMNLTGRRLGDIAVHPLLPTEARVVLVEETDFWIRMTCDHWIRSIEDVRSEMNNARKCKEDAR